MIIPAGNRANTSVDENFQVEVAVAIIVAITMMDGTTMMDVMIVMARA
jgi:hypothetical protein